MSLFKRADRLTPFSFRNRLFVTLVALAVVVAAGIGKVRCDVFVDEDGDAEVISIDEVPEATGREEAPGPCAPEVLARAKRQDETAEDANEDEDGSGEAYEDDKEASCKMSDIFSGLRLTLS